MRPQRAQVLHLALSEHKSVDPLSVYIRKPDDLASVVDGEGDSVVTSQGS